MTTVIATTAVAMQAAVTPVRVRIFIDFWNFTLSVKSHDATFQIDWNALGPMLTQQVGSLTRLPATFEALHVYGSFDPGKPADTKLKGWFASWLDRQPGVQVVLLERQRKAQPPKCPHCQTTVPSCPNCSGDMRGSEEKGIDTRIVTDMVSLAWADAYDAAVLVSADRDFVPAAEFLQSRGVKVIHGGFPPKGFHLSQKCWASIDMISLLPAYRR